MIAELMSLILMILPPVAGSEKSWTKVIEREHYCLAETIYYEARGEPVDGQIAVAETVLERTRLPGFRRSICGVVYQRLQFAQTIEANLRAPRGEAWEASKVLAARVIAGEAESSLERRPTHFHAARIRPYWARSYQRIGRIGDHIFYRRTGV